MANQKYINLLIDKITRMPCSGACCHEKHNLLQMLKYNPTDKIVERAEELLIKASSCSTPKGATSQS